MKNKWVKPLIALAIVASIMIPVVWKLTHKDKLINTSGELLGVTDPKTYYVDKSNKGGTCSDSNNGDIATPFCTISKAINTVVAGDTILIREGTYSSFEITKSGTADGYITISGYNNEVVTIDGAQAASQAVSIRNASFIKVSGLKVTGAVGNYDGGIRLQNGQGNIIENNEVFNNKGTNTQGIIVYDSSNTTVQNNIVHDNYLSGIAVTDSSASGTTMTGNKIIGNTSYNNTNTVSPGNADGIKLSGINHTGTLIKNNIVYSNGDDGIDTWSSHGNTIEGNTAYNHNLAGDGNGIKAGGSTTGGSNTIKFNIVYNNKANGITSNGSGGNKLYHNVAYKNGKHGIEDAWKQTPCTDNACKSVIVGNIGVDNVSSNLSANIDTGESHNNLWFDSATSTAKIAYNYVVKNTLSDFYVASGNRLENPADTGKVSLVANPIFVNIANFDFHLQANSPAIDKSDVTNPGGVTIVGNAPDIGAFEYNAATPTVIPSPTVTIVPTTAPTATPTPTPVPDTTTPLVNITSPVNNATIKRNTNTTISVSASDNVAVTKVEFLIENKIICTDTSSPYSCVWKPTKAGTYIIMVKAYDAANNIGVNSITVKVQ